MKRPYKLILAGIILPALAATWAIIHWNSHRYRPVSLKAMFNFPACTTAMWH